MREVNSLNVSICSCDTHGAPRPTAPRLLSIMVGAMLGVDKAGRRCQCFSSFMQLGNVKEARQGFC